MKPSELLYRAADYMTEHGNIKFMLENEAGGVCATGAIRRAIGLTNITDDASGISTWSQRLLMCEAIGALKPVISQGGFYDMVSWNNSSKITAEDVILGFKQAAHNLAEDGR